MASAVLLMVIYMSQLIPLLAHSLTCSNVCVFRRVATEQARVAAAVAARKELKEAEEAEELAREVCIIPCRVQVPCTVTRMVRIYRVSII